MIGIGAVIVVEVTLGGGVDARPAGPELVGIVLVEAVGTCVVVAGT